MSEAPEITEQAIRENLLRLAKAYAARTGCSLSSIGEAAINDSKFVANVERGKNFTVKTYQRVIDWINNAEATVEAA